jgi:hypothetical protein
VRLPSRQAYRCGVAGVGHESGVGCASLRAAVAGEGQGRYGDVRRGRELTCHRAEHGQGGDDEGCGVVHGDGCGAGASEVVTDFLLLSSI